MPQLLFNSMLLMTLMTLLIPLLFMHPPSPTTIKLATLTSTISTTMFISRGVETMTTSFTWTTTHFNWNINLLFDMYTMTFIPVALFITWAIMEFSLWYMASDPLMNKFMSHLLLFLLAMLTLITANNMLQLFVGWEAVGVMSFMLISWWKARTNATTAALQAIIYNRLGDIGLIITTAWMAMNYNNWDLHQLFAHTPTPMLPALGLILAAAGKSAQFGLHPWLPSAMEGPTPVSALLHSSTMVVAGVFLLIRFFPIIETNKLPLFICLCLGATTTAFAALCAITQNDLKKIIAFSTSSQLGLMLLTLGLAQPTLAFFHMVTHAFFKALLFLCAGSIIHALMNEQDIRKMGGLLFTLPRTTTCTTLATLALMGSPYLAGFYTKDIIIEAALMSKTNAWALLVTLLTTSLTAGYSLRLLFYVLSGHPRSTGHITMTELNPAQTQPLQRLAWGSIFSGLIIATVLLPPNQQTMTMQPTMKLTALMVTALGAIITLDLMYQVTFLTTPSPTKTHTTLSHLFFFNTLNHRATTKMSMQFAQSISLQLKDLAWYETVAPTVVKTKMALTVSKLSLYHTGAIKTHLIPLTIILACLTGLAAL
uniref:NADH-ubiquinone oxidoreductase chain 5 n=1 Tax=Uroplatus ebenaui TaxID=357318 RepID=A0A0A1H9T5_9SAUR|nr:NADH dehydrogenase subunit 5 [Uroplatus ebenaui]BAP90319.1 NADH dehydrogenase subunit 5 [Uroplatus ebenaui]